MINDKTNVIYLETPSNPTLKTTDLKAVEDRSEKKHRDHEGNTFMSPHFQRPLEMGIDVSIHSLTKYLAGHDEKLKSTLKIPRTCVVGDNILGKIVILMGSETDLEFCRQVAKHAKALGLEYEFRVASAHKTPRKVLDILSEFEKEKIVFITVAGRSNTLSAFTDANSTKPVIACPPYSEKFSGADIYSSLRVPSGVGSVLTIEPESAAIAAAKIFALEDKDTARRVREYQQSKKTEIEKADSSTRKLK